MSIDADGSTSSRAQALLQGNLVWDNMCHTFPPGNGYDAGIRMVAPVQLESIVETLLHLGYSDEQVRDILGGN